ncbi:MAG: hypothetical protein IPK78_06995 [Rhodospirillales bacterium]|nr:hypothetical protein [Rhodospirillales bacterium]
MIDTKRLLPIAVVLLTGATPALAQTAVETPATPSPTPEASAAAAEEDDIIPGTIAGTVALTSDYMFRGISQTDNNPAVQGSLEYSLDTGFHGITPYIGFWGSNVDFNDDDNATVEVDTLFGLRGPLLDTGVSWDLGGIYYAYPGASRSGGTATNYDYWEIPVKLTYSPIEDLVSVGAAYYYSPDFFGGTGKANYVNGNVTVTPPVPYVDLALFGGVGFQNIEDSKDYVDWTLGGKVTFKGVDFTIAYTDTNLTQSDLGGNKLSDARVIFTVGAAF